MARTLVTGGSGFVGANLTRRLLSEGHEVHLLLRPGYTRWRLQEIEEEVRIHLGDLRDREEVTRLFEQAGPEWVFHLATYGAYVWQDDVHDMVETNIKGTINLVRAGLEAGVQVIVNTGSSSEYGLKDHAPSEDELLIPNSHYAWTKAAATHFCTYLARCESIPIPTLRLYSVYGPYEEPSRLIPTLIAKGLEGTLPPLVNPDIGRDFVFVEDVCEAYLLAAQQRPRDPGAVYNVGTGKQTTISQLVEIAIEMMGIKEEPAWGSMSARHWDTSTWCGDCRKIQRELGWHPRHALADGLRKTLSSFEQSAGSG